jgi:hypothetical protein
MGRDEGKDLGKRQRTPVESILTGLVVGGGFFAYWLFGGHHMPALVMAIIFGLLPAARGLSKLIAARAAAPAARRIGEREQAAENERSVLRIARDRAGRVTPSIVALDCEMSVEEAERVLDDLAKKGHASMRVREDGRIEYEFAEFFRLET